MATSNIVCLGTYLGHRLELHAGTCLECELATDSATGEPVDCERCDNERVLFWEKWRVHGHGACDVCKADADLTNANESARFELCYPCLLNEHRRLCGCDRWSWAEHPSPAPRRRR